ncbi:hypothetical protein [Psychromonas aquimarina]|uniref:hypothetical protein n=1 Tax=Psychromonas aquimarina TaxID=444919 RepID=UPI0004257386|nr:hypothetical protein [Psychromonas aquimarina]
MTLQLQDLQISGGWFTAYNQFYNVDPSQQTIQSVDTVFTQDILQFTNQSRNRLIDLGWYPEGCYAEGAYRLVVYQGDFSGKLLYQLDSKDKQQIVSEINRLLLQITNGYL